MYNNLIYIVRNIYFVKVYHFTQKGIVLQIICSDDRINNVSKQYIILRKSISSKYSSFLYIINYLKKVK